MTGPAPTPDQIELAELLAATINLYRAAEQNIPTAPAREAWEAIARATDVLKVKASS